MSNHLDQRLTTNDRDHTSSTAGAFTRKEPSDRPTKLRRWSVAELIARAVPRPPAGGVAH
jgi:hypothetical protein